MLASFVAIMRYPQINDWAVRLFGAGAEPWMFILIVCLSLAAFIALFWRMERPDEEDAPPPAPLT